MKKQYIVEYFEGGSWYPGAFIHETLEDAIKDMQETPNDDKLPLRIIEETISRTIISQ